MYKVIQNQIARNISLATLAVVTISTLINTSVYAASTITIALSTNNINLQIAPNKTGVFDSADIDVRVTTSSTYGYTLNMTAASTSLYRTAAVNGETPAIPTLLNQFSQTSFPTGCWGYKTSINANYSPVFLSNIIADPNESTANVTDSNIVTFAAKLDNDTPAGTYATTLNFTVTGKTPQREISQFMTIDGATHQFEKGMTWSEWVDSGYNTDGYIEEGGKIKVTLYGDTYWVTDDDCDGFVSSGDAIDSQFIYYLYQEISPSSSPIIAIPCAKPCDEFDLDCDNEL